ncbi:MAG: F0F1 ATP synthase subunit epsilon [Pseudomonadota bacterium]
MAETIQFDLVAPERAVASVRADRVEAPGAEGIFTVLPNHAPLVTVLAPGVVRYHAEGSETRIFVRGGFAEITPAGFTILAEEAVPVTEFDKEDIRQRIKNCEEDLSDSDSTEETRIFAARELEHLKEIKAAL